MNPALQLHIPNNIPAWLDAINQNVHITSILEIFYGLSETLRDRPGDVLVGPCPLHGGRAEEFYVYDRYNTWACYGRCHRGGLPLDFVALKEGVSYPMAALLLQSWYDLDLHKLGLVKPDGGSVGK